MKAYPLSSQQSHSTQATPRHPHRPRTVVAIALALMGSAQMLSAAQTVNELYALPDSCAAANTVSAVASALPAKDSLSAPRQIAITLIEAGLLIGTTTSVHELGHANRVRAVNGRSRWETGDVNWWSYFAHRNPLASGETLWQLPTGTSLKDQLSIVAGGFNATTTWDENNAGQGSLGLVTARYSTLLYGFASVSTQYDDLAQIEQLYRANGQRISRQELQLWQLFAGCLSQIGSRVRTYAYFTPNGVSMRAVTQWKNWSLATEAVVHGTSTIEVEAGPHLTLGNHIAVLPKVLLSTHGVGGSLKATGKYRDTTVSLDLQYANPNTLRGTRTTTRFELSVTSLL